MNFLYSVVLGVRAEAIVIPATPPFVYPFRLVLLITVETALAVAFGYVLIRLEKMGHGIPLVASLVIALCSAWTSLFNIQWLVLGGPMDLIFIGSYQLHLLGWSSVTFLLAAYFIGYHASKNFVNIDEDVMSVNMRVVMIPFFYRKLGRMLGMGLGGMRSGTIQLIAYIIMYNIFSSGG